MHCTEPIAVRQPRRYCHATAQVRLALWQFSRPAGRDFCLLTGGTSLGIHRPHPAHASIHAENHGGCYRSVHCKDPLAPVAIRIHAGIEMQVCRVQYDAFAARMQRMGWA